MSFLWFAYADYVELPNFVKFRDFGLISPNLFSEVFNILLFERWGRASSFGFSALGLCVGKNQMCLTVRWHFRMWANIVIYEFLMELWLLYSPCTTKPSSFRFIKCSVFK